MDCKDGMELNSLLLTFSRKEKSRESERGKDENFCSVLCGLWFVDCALDVLEGRYCVGDGLR